MTVPLDPGIGRNQRRFGTAIRSVNVVGSQAGRIVEHPIHVPVDPEVTVTSTKVYTGTLLC
jgi:glucosamine 6-phosphate synthetase-like amidotransferase/phosphosugar isomerase protein